MNSEVIIESGMTFGPFPAAECFYIEKSKTYAKIQQHVQMAEFLLLRHDRRNPVIWVIEAKSSSPKSETQPNFDNYINDIHDKLVNAFLLGMASCLKRHALASSELSQQFRKLDLAKTDFKFILIVNGHKDDWLVPLRDALYNALRATVRTWALSPMAVAVLNEVGARKYGLIE